ncbi:Actin-like protein 8 [Fukomys damarensis]|uniref:Actin-like protein 8 n=1 Tax=Fukomys damarensis TaxID=885580 RepID=A0A091CXE1_FUKDA|nr:Actin-like protein 8 [Fukomys damarensis]
MLQHHKQGHKDCPVMLMELLLKEPVTHKTLEIMFELLEMLSLFLDDQLEMSLYASGLLTGVVVNLGYSLTQVQPFLLGQSLTDSGRTLEFASEDLSMFLFKSLFKEECDKHLFQMDMVATIQMSKCCVLKNLEEVLHFHQSLPGGSNKGNTYQLPDGSPLELTLLQRMAAEIFFSQQAFGPQGPSISQTLVYSSPMRTPGRQCSYSMWWPVMETAHILASPSACARS